jgi:hypothetical protein
MDLQGGFGGGGAQVKFSSFSTFSCFSRKRDVFGCCVCVCVCVCACVCVCMDKRK